MKKILILLVASTLVSCSLKLSEAQVEMPDSYIYNDDFYTSIEPLDERWWESFDDAQLSELVECAMLNNRNLLATVEAVEASRNYLRVARASFLPSLSADVTAEVVHELKTTEQEYTLAPTLEWEISLFGELRNTKKAAAAAWLQEEWNLRAVWLSLSAEVATSYFTLMQYQRSLYIATRSYELRRQETALIDSMYRYGMSDGTALMQAKSLVYSAKVEVQKFERAVSLTSLSLSTLVGENPQKVNWQNDGEALICDKLPIDTPLGLPSALLERRPDVMKSYYAMAEAAAKVGISRAERYPSITITGSGGVYATSLKGLTSGDPLYWSGIGELVAPIFSWGSLRRKEMMERNNYQASVLSYEQTILEAVADVEKALVAINTYSSEGAASTALVLANSRIAQNTTALYKGGMGNYLSVIDAERELYASQISLIEIVTQQYINYINLFKALGGGYN